MEQRQVRLGDVLDDYCTRERRVTNHAVVALVGNDVKLTRCTTCDTEHPYKAAKVPPRRQTKLVAAPSPSSPRPETPSPALQGSNGQGASRRDEVEVGTPLAFVPTQGPQGAPVPPMPLRIDSVRRPLIRASLARPEGAPPPARQVPVFTIRNQHGGANERGPRKGRGGGRPGAEPNGNRIDGYQGQSTRPAAGQNGSQPSRTRGSGSAPDRPERANRSHSRNRGKGRPR